MFAYFGLQLYLLHNDLVQRRSEVVCEVSPGCARGMWGGTFLKCSCDCLSEAVRVGGIFTLQGDGGPQRMGEGLEAWAQPTPPGSILFSTGHRDLFLSHSHCFLLPTTGPSQNRSSAGIGGGGTLRLEGDRNSLRARRWQSGGWTSALLCYVSLTPSLRTPSMQTQCTCKAHSPYHALVHTPLYTPSKTAQATQNHNSGKQQACINLT